MLTLLSPNEKLPKCTIVKCTSHNIRLGKGSQFDAKVIIHVVTNFYGTEIEIWARFGPVGNTKKNWANYEGKEK